MYIYANDLDKHIEGGFFYEAGLPLYRHDDRGLLLARKRHLFLS